MTAPGSVLTRLFYCRRCERWFCPVALCVTLMLIGVGSGCAAIAWAWVNLR